MRIGIRDQRQKTKTRNRPYIRDIAYPQLIDPLREEASNQVRITGISMPGILFMLIIGLTAYTKQSTKGKDLIALLLVQLYDCLVMEFFLTLI
jgi:hypothetical protein